MTKINQSYWSITGQIFLFTCKFSLYVDIVCISYCIELSCVIPCKSIPSDSEHPQLLFHGHPCFLEINQVHVKSNYTFCFVLLYTTLASNKNVSEFSQKQMPGFRELQDCAEVECNLSECRYVGHQMLPLQWMIYITRIQASANN